MKTNTLYALCMMLFSISTFTKAQNNALHFDGINDNVFATMNSIGQEDFTIECWFNQDALIDIDKGIMSIVKTGLEGDLSVVNLAINNGQIVYYIKPSNTVADFWFQTGEFIEPGICYHLAFVKEGSGLKMYLNGQLIDNRPNLFTPQFELGPFITIGNLNTFSTDYFWNGQLDEVRIWQESRSANEIMSTMNLPLMGNESGLLFYADFDQGIPNGNNPAIVFLNEKVTPLTFGTLNNFSLNGPSSNWVESCVILSELCIDDCCPLGSTNDFQDLPVGPLTSSITSQNPTWYAHSGTMDVVSPGCQDPNSILIHPATQVVQPVLALTGGSGIAGPVPLFLKDKYYCFEVCAKIEFSTAYGFVYLSHPNGTIAQSDILFDGEGWVNLDFPIWQADADYYNLHLTVYGANTINSLVVPLNIDNVCITEVSEPAVCKSDFTYELLDCGQVCLTDMSCAENYTRTWTRNGATFSSAETACSTVSNSGTYEFCLSIESPNCSDTYCESIEVIIQGDPPVVICPADNTIETTNVDCKVEGILDDPSVDLDDCAFSSETICIRSDGLPLSDLYCEGITTINCVVTDDLNNSASCSYTIEVVCTPDPIFELCGQAVVTCFSGVDGTSGNFRIPNPNGPVLGLLNVRDRSGVNVGTNWTAASAGHYHHNSWTAQNLGEIFGIALDDSGNIYVTNSTVYGSHPFGPLGGGGIYKVNASSGAITNLVALPNGNDPSQGPGLGNICYSPLYDLLYATNFHDGLIYIVDPNTGNIISTFDPFLVSAPDPTINYSFAPLGDRPWGIGINPSEPDKLYFGNWVESIKAFDGIVNQIYSVSLNSLGLPVGVEQLEVDVSEFISRDRSAPCSDIAFSQDNKMLIAQRSMEGNIIPDFILIWAHESYIAEYERATVSPFDWVISNGNISPYQNGFHNKFRVGDYRDGGNSAGGVDYGYESFTTGLPMICDAMVWATGDALSPSHANANSAEPWIYGLQGLSSTGGTVNNSYLIDFNNNVISWDKTQIGDVEIFKCFSCNADTTDCDLLSIEYVALNDEDETTCCYSANVTNNFGIELNKICIDLTNTPEWIINTGSLSSGYSWDFVSSYKLCIENANGFPVGTSNDVFSYCLSEINNAVMPADTQCVVTSWFIDDLQTQCQDTIKFECGEIQGDTCMVISNIMTMCNPENDYSYCICFDVTNNSGQDAANLKLENLSTGFVFVNGCGGTGFPLGGNTHLYDFYEADGVTPAFKDGTTENLCVNIIANTIISNNTNVSFQASLYNDEACCSEPEIIELQVDPCCDPCSEINTVVIANDDTSTDSTCCYLLSIESSCSYQYFSKVQIDIVTPGIGFGYFGNASPIDWDMVGNDQSITMTPSLAGSIPQGISNILDFCLTDVDEPSEVPQQIRIQYYTLDPALDEIVACDTLIELNCPLSKNACAFVFNEQIECDVDNQKYNITVDVKNLSNPDFAATELLVTPGSIAQYVNPWTFQLTPPLTNDNSSRTVSFCYEPPVFPDPDGLLPIKWFLHNATKDSCCAGHELLFDTLYLPPCLPPCEIVCPDDLTVNCCGPVTLPTPTLEGDCTSATFSCVRADGLALTDPFDIGATCITCELDGAMESCTYCVTVIDTPPVLSCPIDVTILEGDSILPDVLGEASVEDDCSNLTATYEDNITNNGVCPYVIERVWKANDGCNEEVTCTQFIQVQCPIPCELICPDDLTVNCCGTVTLPSPTLNGACIGATFTCVRADGLVLTDPFDIGATCITCALDGAMESCTYCVTVIDTPPVLSCPIDVTILEGDSVLPDVLGEASVEDDCSNLTATYEDNITNNGVCPYVIERVWKANDGCNEEVTCTQFIQVQCSAQCELICPDDLTVNCCGPVTLPSPTFGSACQGSVVCVRADGLSLTDPFDEGITCITCELAAEMLSCTYCVTVVDMPPMITCPIDVTIVEGDVTLPIALGEALVEDDCSSVTATYMDNITNNGICPYDIEREWKAIDDCGQEVACVQHIKIDCEMMSCPQCFSDLTYDPVCIDLDGTVDITWNNLCLDQTIGITLINCTTGTVVGNSVITTQNTGSYLWQNPIPNLTPGMYQLYVECIAGNWWQYGTCFEIGECDTTCCVDFEAPIVLNASDDPTNPLIEVDYVDVDGDAYLDQVYFTQLSPNGNTLAWRKNMQNSKFDVAQPVLPNVPWLAKRLPYNYDINSDNYEELFIVNFSTGELEYIEASSIGLDFTTINPLGINIGADGFYAIGDLNNDGCPDLVLRTGVDRDVYFYEGSCNPIVSSFNRINTPLLTITPDNGDFPVPEIYDGDCDGDEDLYFGLSGEIRMYENLGTSVGVGSLPDINLAYLSNVHNVTGISNTTEFVIPRFVDVDNDGDKDLFIDDQSQLQYYENNCDPVLPCTCPTVQEQVVSFEGLESTINCGATFMLPENVTSDIVVSGDFDCSSSCTNGQISWQIASAIGLQTGTSNTGSYSITLSSAWFSKSGSYTFVLNGSCDMESCNSCSITFEVPSTICVCNDFSNVQMTTQNNIYDLDCGLDEFRNLLECPQIDPIIAIDGQVGCAGGCMMSVLNWELRRNGVLYVYNGTSLDNQMTGVDAFGNYQIDLSTVDYWEPGNYRIAAVGFCDATTKCECNHEWIVEDDCDCNCNDFNNIDPILIQDFFNSNSCTIQFHFDNVGPCDVIEWTWQVVGVPLTAISKTTIGSAPVQFTGLDDTAYLLSAQIVRTPVDQNACSRNFSNVYILNCGSTTGGSGDLSFIHDGLVHEGVADYNLEVDENNDVVNVSAINDLEAYGLDVKLGQTKGFGYTHNSWIENVNENDRQFTARYYGSRNGIENSLLRVNQEEIVFMDGEPYVRWVVDNSTLGVINNQLIITDPTDGIIADLTLGNGEPLYFKSNGGTDIYVPETNTEFISSRSNEDNITVMLPNNDLIEVPAGSTMKISAINPQGVVDFFSLVEMRWIGSGTDALFNEHVIMFEDMVSNHAMGNMLFAANNSGNQLDLLNISDGDEEDLLVRWPYCSGVSTNGVTHENIWESKLLKNFNNDASMRINLIGDIEEEGDRTLSTIDITSSTDGFYQIDPFVNLPSSTMVTHQFYQDGSLVDEWTGSLAETALRSDGFPISSTGYGDNLNSVFTVGLGFEPGAILSLNGNEFVADAYRAALEIDNNKYKIRHCTYSMKNVDSMTMLDENCEVDIIDNIEEKLDSPLGIKIYPNPNSGNFNIEFDEILSDNVIMTLTNVMGQKVHHQLLTHYERAFTVDLNDLESGVYILSLKTKNGLRFTTKIIKI